MRYRPKMIRPSIVMLPNGFTLANLFFGIFAIVTAARGNHTQAAWYIVFGGVFDAFDGRVARATNSGTPFGEELDSLVDAISFGVAPALMMYFAVLKHQGWDWIFVFLFVACAVMRLARFNVESSGEKKAWFTGLPSPAAGGTLATYWWFSQTPLYNETIIGEWPWHWILRFLMIALSFLMISNVPYPAWPTFTLRTWSGRIGITVFVSSLLALIYIPKEFFFSFGLLYVSFGVIAAGVRGLLEREPPQRRAHQLYTRALDDDEDDDGDEDEDDDVAPRQGRGDRSAPTHPLRGDRERERARGRRDRDSDREARRERRPERAPEPRVDARPERPRPERPARVERPPRPPRTERETAPPASVVSTDAADILAPIAIDPLSVTGAEAPVAESAPAGDERRKRRKRRRRRGGDRNRADGSTVAGGGDTTADGGADDGGDDSPYENDGGGSTADAGDASSDSSSD
ncbi:MAG: CDP-diacylglycerol--serine O-phosphatidyltransferase [Gemmatimonadaceae bacterium]|nr:CDP-diacylglycerol--serine O-phosphatidyltransferase [Gemmatimonadaceae bacterium]